MPPSSRRLAVRDYARHVDFPVASADSRGIQFAFLHKEIYSPAVLDAQHIHDLVAADYQRASIPCAAAVLIATCSSPRNGSVCERPR